MNQQSDQWIHFALSEDRADVYFARTQTILQQEGLNPVVTMEIFANSDGLLCGMKEVLALLRKVLPADRSEVWALGEGEAMQAKEVVLRITGPYRSFCLYETAILGILAHESGWATAARACVRAAGDTPVISFGARHVHPAVTPYMEYAAIVGGCVGCSTPAGAELAGIEPPPGLNLKAVSLLSPRKHRVRYAEEPSASTIGSRRVLRAHPDFDPSPWQRMLRAMVTGSTKYIWGSDGRHELYDLDVDPGEQNNLKTRRSERLAVLARQTEAYFAKLRTRCDESDKIKPLTEKERRLFRSLGYVGDAEEKEDTSPDDDS